MKQVFFTELKNKCTEINNCETDTANQGIWHNSSFCRYGQTRGAFTA